MKINMMFKMTRTHNSETISTLTCHTEAVGIVDTITVNMKHIKRDRTAKGSEIANARSSSTIRNIRHSAASRNTSGVLNKISIYWRRGVWDFLPVDDTAETWETVVANGVEGGDVSPIDSEGESVTGNGKAGAVIERCSRSNNVSNLVHTCGVSEGDGAACVEVGDGNGVTTGMLAAALDQERA